jgi:hypothetical protein
MKQPASAIPRFSIVKHNNKHYVLENKIPSKHWVNLIWDENGVRHGEQILKTTELEVVYYPAQAAFELLNQINSGAMSETERTN